VTEPRRRRILRIPFRTNAAGEETDDEIRFHLDMKTEKLRKMGFTESEAKAEAERRFGDVEKVREEVEELMRRRERAMRSFDHMDNLRRNSAYAIRQMVRNPMFSAVAVLTIAIAIGATTSVYSVVDTILLRPLPYAQPNELVMIWADYTRREGPLREWLSYPNFVDFRTEVTAVEASSLFTGWTPTLSGSGQAEQLSGASFTHGMFAEVLAVEPALGRGFTPEDDIPSTNVILISNGFWKRALGADPSIIGRDILLNDVPQTVIGVMPARFQPPALLGTDVWSPLGMDMSTDPPRGNANFRSIGRMVSSGSLAVARTQSEELGRRLEREFPEDNTGMGYYIVPLKTDLVLSAATPLWVLLGSVGFVLLIACVNVANLLLARGAMRESELAVRSALGAGRRGILGQLMTESVILAMIGGALGTVLAFGGTELLVWLAPADTPRLSEVAVDGRVLAFAAGVTAAAGLLFGMLPAARASRTEPAVVLREGGRSGPGLRAGRLRSALVVGQIGLTLVLLVGAGLLVRSFQNLQAVDPGFTPKGVLTLQVFMPSTRYPDAVARRDFMTNVEARLSGIPSVAGVGSVNSLPMASLDGDVTFNVEGEPMPEAGEQIVWLRRATTGYFDAMGLQLMAGRAFDEGDTDDDTQVIIVNETMATRYFGDPRNAVGQRINVNSPANTTWRPIVGVVRDVKNFGIRNDSRNAMYVPFAQLSSPFMFIVIRTEGDPLSVAAAVRREIEAVDAAIAVANVQAMDDYVSASLATDRFSTALLSGFALVALLLAVVGLYGVVSYSVSTRRREMGIRIALGAGTSTIRTLILRWSLGLAAMGIAFGAVGAVGITRLMSSLLFGVSAADPATFAATAGLMAAATVLASLVPAMRATRVDPVRVLKAE